VNSSKSSNANNGLAAVIIIAVLLLLAQYVIYTSHSVGTTLVALIPMVLALGVAATLKVKP